MRSASISMVVFVVAALSAETWGAPAAPIEVTLTQADGLTFEARTVGDEYRNWTETLDGHTIIESGGSWYYAAKDAAGDLIPTALRVGAASASELQQIPTGLSPGTDSRERTTGPKRSLAASDTTRFATSPHTQPVLVILLAFSDIAFADYDPDTPATAFSDLMFGGSASVVDYFDEVSYGAFDVVPATESQGTANDGVIEVTLGTNHPNAGTGSVASQIAAAFAGADAFIDYAAFDTNLDGDLTPEELSIVVIFAGYENAFGGSSSETPRIWGHMSAITPVASGDSGTTLSWYTAFGERHALDGEVGDIATIGIMCHELGHLMFGLPDLYDTDSSSEGIGTWGLMGAGSWNGLVRSGDSPAHFSAWSKKQTGMLTPTDILAATSGASFANAATNADAKRLWIDRYRLRENFLIENRRLTGYDSALPAPGLLIWHIDEGQTVNANDVRRLVDLEEADGFNDLDTKFNRGDGGDVYPGTSSNVAFDGSSTPNSNDHDGSATGIGVTSISAAAATMTATLTPSATGGLGDHIRYDEGGAEGYGWGNGVSTTRWSALRVTNDTSNAQLEGIEVYTLGNATVDIYVYQSMVADTPTTLLTSKTGNATTAGWNRILLDTPQAFAVSTDLFLVLRIADPASGGYPLAIDVNTPWSGRWWDDSDGAGAFTVRTEYDLNQIALVGSPAGADVVYVNHAHPGPYLGTQSNPYQTVTDALGAVSDGGEVRIAAGAYDETSGAPLTINQAVTLKATGGTVTVN